MDAGPQRASRAIEDLRLQLAADELAASGVLPGEAAFEASKGLGHVLAERGLLGLELEALRRQARQQRRHAREQISRAARQREVAAAQWAWAVSRLDSAARRDGSGRWATLSAGSGRRA